MQTLRIFVFCDAALVARLFHRLLLYIYDVALYAYSDLVLANGKCWVSAVQRPAIRLRLLFGQAIQGDPILFASDLFLQGDKTFRIKPFVVNMVASPEPEEESFEGLAQDDSDGDGAWSDRQTVRSQPLYTPKKSLMACVLVEGTLRQEKKKDERRRKDVARDTWWGPVGPHRLPPATS